jgi:hypothetical protein
MMGDRTKVIEFRGKFDKARPKATTSVVFILTSMLLCAQRRIGG